MRKYYRKDGVRVCRLCFLGFPKYLVDVNGIVWTKQFKGVWRKMSLRPGDRLGHLKVTLCSKGIKKDFYVHRLILLAFVSDCPERAEGCHNDGDVKNNQLSNLRWDTRKSNHADKKKHGTNRSGERNPMSVLLWREVEEIRQMYATGDYFQTDLASMYGVSKQTLNKIIHHKIWI